MLSAPGHDPDEIQFVPKSGKFLLSVFRKIKPSSWGASVTVFWLCTVTYVMSPREENLRFYGTKPAHLCCCSLLCQHLCSEFPYFAKSITTLPSAFLYFKMWWKLSTFLQLQSLWNPHSSKISSWSDDYIQVIMRWMDICQCPNLAVVSEATENLEISKNPDQRSEAKEYSNFTRFPCWSIKAGSPANKGWIRKGIGKRSGEFAERKKKISFK